MSDGTIHGDNGTIWATTGTRISSNGMTGQLDGTYKDYGLTGLSETGSKKPDPQLKAKFALFNKDYTPGFGPNQHNQVVKQIIVLRNMQIIQKTLFKNRTC